MGPKHRILGNDARNALIAGQPRREVRWIDQDIEVGCFRQWRVMSHVDRTGSRTINRWTTGSIGPDTLRVAANSAGASARVVGLLLMGPVYTRARPRQTLTGAGGSTAAFLSPRGSGDTVNSACHGGKGRRRSTWSMPAGRGFEWRPLHLLLRSNRARRTRVTKFQAPGQQTAAGGETLKFEPGPCYLRKPCPRDCRDRMPAAALPKWPRVPGLYSAAAGSEYE